MPHIMVKMQTGRSDALKTQLSDTPTHALMEALGSADIKGVRPRDWVEQVYEPDILGKSDTLYKRPGYDPLCR